MALRAANLGRLLMGNVERKIARAISILVKPKPNRSWVLRSTSRSGSPKPMKPSRPMALKVMASTSRPSIVERLGPMVNPASLARPSKMGLIMEEAAPARLAGSPVSTFTVYVGPISKATAPDRSTKSAMVISTSSISTVERLLPSKSSMLVPAGVLTAKPTWPPFCAGKLVSKSITGSPLSEMVRPGRLKFGMEMSGKSRSGNSRSGSEMVGRDNVPRVITGSVISGNPKPESTKSGRSRPGNVMLGRSMEGSTRLGRSISGMLGKVISKSGNVRVGSVMLGRSMLGNVISGSP